ncbi:hypothetical protein DL96DRAFT_1688238 [Flagelloscypha sp. PMI_526]|nr:hypothetical protein DL96DRAFT_1688238 [Flagelloscypha sp. PMI_526]
MFTRVSRFSRPAFRSPFVHSRRSFIPLRPPSSSHALRALSWTSLGVLGIGMVGLNFLWNHRPSPPPPTITVLNDEVFNTNFVDIVSSLPVIPESRSEQEEYYRKCLREFVRLAKQGPDYELQAAFAMLKATMVALLFFQLEKAPLRHEVLLKDAQEAVPSFDLGVSLEKRARVQDARTLFFKVIEDMVSEETSEEVTERQGDEYLTTLENKYGDVMPPEITAKAGEQEAFRQQLQKLSERDDYTGVALLGEIVKGCLLASAGPQFYDRAAEYLSHAFPILSFKSLAAYRAHLPKEVVETVMLLLVATEEKRSGQKPESKLGETQDGKS